VDVKRILAGVLCVRGIAERSAGEDVELRDSVDENRDELILAYEG